MPNLQSYFDDTLSLPLFLKIKRYVKEHLGIQLNDSKRVMVETRLRKRLKKLSIYKFKEYVNYLLSPEGAISEHDALIDVITTNKTDFFREPHHFEYLTQTVLPELFKLKGFSHTVRIWSAACSKGAEPYTLAMVMEEFKLRYPRWCGRYSILATDISLEILEMAQRAIYSEEEIEPVAKYMRRKYLLRSKNPDLKQVRMTPEIRSKVDFRRLNLMDDFSCSEPMDIIFCRNVLIYFDKATQNKVVDKLLKNLRTNGYLMMGHSETLELGRFNVINCAPSIYKKL